MTTISAKSLKASVPADIFSLEDTRRGDTFELVYPRAIHAEFMTHKVIAKNASSSRAKPVKKVIQEIIDNPFIPLHWGKNQKGMQAYEINNELINDPILQDHQNEVAKEYPNFSDPHGEWHPVMVTNEKAWLNLRDMAIRYAEAFDAAGYHKQIINRILEPWSHIKVVATASQWANFFGLRTHSAAEPHFQILANEILSAYKSADVQVLGGGQWHMPYVDDTTDFSAIKTSVACCASTSYDTVEGEKMTPSNVDRIFDQLVGSQPVHASPAEHQFRFDGYANVDGKRKWLSPKQGGNLGDGFIQYRKLLPNETITTM